MERLHEFYGMLAWHYSKADNLEKAEEYMVKAGEEALRSSASSEALNYFQQALQLYIEKYGEAADPEKLAAFEKNIGLAYFNKVQFKNALPHFDKVLLRWRRRPPTNKVGVVAKLAYDLAITLLRLYLPSISPKRIPDSRINQFFELAVMKDIALNQTNPRRCFTETIGDLRESLKYDLTKLDIAAVLHLTAGAVYSAAGFYRIAQKVLHDGGKLVDDNKIQDLVVLHAMTTVRNYYVGKWIEIPEYDKSLFDTAAKGGVFWYVAVYAYMQGAVKAYKGRFSKARESFEDLVQLEEKYHYGGVGRRMLATDMTVVGRSLSQAQVDANNLLSFSIERGLEVNELQALGWKAVTLVLMKDISGAKGFLTRAEHIRRKQDFAPPGFLCNALLAQFMLDLHLLEDAIGGDSRSSISEYSRAALKSGKAAVKNSAKFAAHRTWNYRLMGEYYWLLGKQRKALKWWNKSIKEGERLGARPDLSRTYMEVGKRLLELHSKYKELNGVAAKEYLEKAETMFREMDLEWDIEELEKIRYQS